MSETPILIDYAPELCTLTINRAATRNALGLEVLEGLDRALEQLSVRLSGDWGPDTPRAVVLRGLGEKVFVAGADIKLMSAAGADELRRFIALGQGVMRRLELLPVPSIAAVHGHAFGGGLELALACDLIVTVPEAQLGQPEVQLGLIPGFGGTQRLALRVGLGAAKRLILTGESVSGEEAFRIGLVEYLAPSGKLDTVLDGIIATIRGKSAVAIREAKLAVAAPFEESLARGLRAEVEHFLSVSATGDAAEGLQAFIEKRSPQFPGR